jgi:hypothetical protein
MMHIKPKSMAKKKQVDFNKIFEINKFKFRSFIVRRKNLFVSQFINHSGNELKAA